MTRIIGGELGGRRLRVPTGVATRPTSDRVREGLFSTLASLTELVGSRFIDLYAGSGAVGLEAASRGAASVLLVENDARAARVARANIVALGVGECCQLATAPVLAALARQPVQPYDIVFVDPPYELSERDLAATLAVLADKQWLAEGAVVAVERSVRTPAPAWPDHVTPERSRRYGETMVWYGRRS